MKCVFCELAAGTLPCQVVYEDEHVMAFMDVGPIVKGHVLVIPRRHMGTLQEAPDSVLPALLTTVRAVAQAQTSGLHAQGVNVLQNNGAVAGQVVPHLHFHVIPRYEHDGHRWRWNPMSYDSPEEMAATASTLRSEWPHLLKGCGP